MNLEHYLAHDIDRDQRAVKRLRKISEAVLETFKNSCGAQGAWPYQLVADTDERIQGRYSRSTGAMIVHAMSVTVGRIPHGQLVPAVRTWRPLPQPDGFSPMLVGATRRLFHEFPQSRFEPLNDSETWGLDDPLTLTWLCEVLNQASAPAALLNRVRRVGGARLDQLFADPDSGVLVFDESVETQVVPHPFPIVSLLKLQAAIGDTKTRNVGPLKTWLRNELHTQLSVSSIRDGGFDPASLVFSLEGLVLLDEDGIEDAVVQRVIDVLQSTPVPHWRPVKPLTLTSRGLVLLPQSVEVANSLLRTCDVLDTNSVDSLFGQSLEMLRTYTEWLESRALRGSFRHGRGREFEFVGWQSEHTFAPSVVHLWATSQVLLYLQHYAAMLEQHIARALRIDAGLAYSALADIKEAKRNWSWDGDDGVLSQEPLLDLPETSTDRIFSTLNEEFVLKRASGVADDDAAYSMLLYGPPGTGKSSLAKNLARKLEYDFISVSPSDFLRTGEEGVEARAKRIFEVLTEQSDVVVLFDEIDRLLLDRSSDEYGLQSDMFQFMTPSMLTKIHDLRDRQRCVFVIATNYAERIDPAITRPGRIDQRLLLLPPDWLQRCLILAEEADYKLSDRVLYDVADRTPLYVYSELKSIAQDLAQHARRGAVAEARIASTVERLPAAISTSSYRSRFFTREKDVAAQRLRDLAETPWREFTFLLYLRGESLLPVSEDWCKQVLEKIISEQGRAISRPILDLARLAVDPDPLG